MADQINFTYPTENICREISNEHHFRFIISYSLYRSNPSIIISKFTEPKETHNVHGDGHGTYNAVCYSIFRSELSFKKIKTLAADEIHENGNKYQLIPNQTFVVYMKFHVCIMYVSCIDTYRYIHGAMFQYMKNT